MEAFLHIWKTALYKLEIWGYAVTQTAQVREKPYGVLLEEKRAILYIMHQCDCYVREVEEQTVNAARCRNGVTILDRVSGDVAQCPCGLFANAIVWRVDQTNEVGKGATVYNHYRLSITKNNRACLFFRSRSNVGENPRCLILKVGTVVVFQEEGKTRNQTSVNHEVDWRIVI